MSRKYGSCASYMYEIKKRNDAVNCGFKSGFIAGVTMCIPLCLYSYNNLGLMKLFIICSVIILTSAFWSCKKYGEKWDHTQRVKDYYEKNYPSHKCEKMLILREGGYSAAG